MGLLVFSVLVPIYKYVNDLCTFTHLNIYIELFFKIKFPLDLEYYPDAVMHAEVSWAVATLSTHLFVFLKWRMTWIIICFVSATL